MRWLLPLLLASLATLILSVSSFARQDAPPSRGSFWSYAGHKEPRDGRRVPARFFCGRPATLRIRRFEDGSAQLRCGGHVLVRVSVPG